MPLRPYLVNDLFLGFAFHALLGHALAKPFFEPLHPLSRTLESHRPAQFFGLASAEARHRHGDAQELFLEEGNPECSFENRFEGGVGVGDRFASGPPVQVGVNHLSDNGTGPDDRNLHHEIVETFGTQSWQGCHLRAALDLEGAHGVGALDHRVGGRIIGGQVRQVDLHAFMTTNQRNRFFQGRQHPKPQKVDLDDAEIAAVVLVPLHDPASFHAGRFDGDDPVQPPAGNDDAPTVLAEMTGKSFDAVHQVEPMGDHRNGGIDSPPA